MSSLKLMSSSKTASPIISWLLCFSEWYSSSFVSNLMPTSTAAIVFYISLDFYSFALQNIGVYCFGILLLFKLQRYLNLFLPYSPAFYQYLTLLLCHHCNVCFSLCILLLPSKMSSLLLGCSFHLLFSVHTLDFSKGTLVLTDIADKIYLFNCD